MQSASFRDLGLSPELLKAVEQMGFEQASAIQTATIPALLGIVPLWLAVLLHEGGTVLVGLNSLRLLRR